jgi:hypothetical protein
MIYPVAPDTAVHDNVTAFVKVPLATVAFSVTAKAKFNT